jgi:hypothetical protein
MEVDMTKQLDTDRYAAKRRGLAATVLAATTLALGAGAALAAPGEPRTLGDPSGSARDRDAVAERFDAARQDVDSLDEIGRVVVAEVKVEKPRKEKPEKPEEPKPEYGTPESVGVSQSTLDAIASCESGGDPTAVDPSGTYFGKYQFDLATWAGVGGSGNPAAAPEAEQDYRAAVLMSQAGSSPWPVCG